MTIVIASSNKDKIREFKEILPNVEFKSLADINFNEEIIEDGKTFLENAYIKAKKVYDKTKMTVIADDSGISANALDGAPGIYSKRYSGKGDLENNKLLVLNLKDKDRSAFYTCALCLIIDGRVYEVEEHCYGEIIDEGRGTNGFGYDPHFYLKEYQKTMAELTREEKNAISHRGKALRKLKDIIISL